MPRYHISPDGQPRSCTAKTACRYGDDTPHFSTKQDAQTAYEASQKGSFSPVSLSKKAYAVDPSFIFEGKELQTDLWFLDESRGFGSSRTSVNLVADGVSYMPRQEGYKWSAARYREVKDGWTSMRNTQSFNTFGELADHVEALAETQARKKLGPEASPEDVRDHLRAEKVRYEDDKES